MQSYYNRLPLSVCENYQDVKQALLQSVRMTSKAYLEKFKKMRRTGKETYAQFLCRLKDVHEYYLESKEIISFDALKQNILLERLREGLPPDVRFFAESRVPKSPEELVQYADLHYTCKSEAVAEDVTRNKEKYGQIISRNVTAEVNEPRPMVQNKPGLQENKSLQRPMQNMHHQKTRVANGQEKNFGAIRSCDARGMHGQARSDKLCWNCNGNHLR